MATKEIHLVRNAFERLKNIRGVRVCCEVPLLGRSVDLAYSQSGLLTTVEFKLHDWRRGITQARDHLLGADYAYICMPKRNVSDNLLKEFEEAGVGLLFHRRNGSWPFEMVFKAPRSRETWKVARKTVLEYICYRKGNRVCHNPRKESSATM